jgi:hypothetical protein
MRRYSTLLVLALALVACTVGGTITVQSVAEWIKSNCGAIVTLVDLAALISANPTVANAAALGGQVCEAIKAQRAELLKASPRGAPVPTDGVVVVGGIPIHYEVK